MCLRNVVMFSDINNETIVGFQMCTSWPHSYYVMFFFLLFTCVHTNREEAHGSHAHRFSQQVPSFNSGDTKRLPLFPLKAANGAA